MRENIRYQGRIAILTFYCYYNYNYYYYWNYASNKPGAHVLLTNFLYLKMQIQVARDKQNLY